MGAPNFTPEQLASLQPGDVKNEIRRLRGAAEFTSHHGLTLSKNHLQKMKQKRDEGDDPEAAKKKKLMMVFMVLVAFFVYTNFM